MTHWDNLNAPLTQKVMNNIETMSMEDKDGTAELMTSILKSSFQERIAHALERIANHFENNYGRKS